MKNSIKPVNMAIAAGSLLFVVAWHWIATLNKPRLEKIAAELVANPGIRPRAESQSRRHEAALR